MKAYLLKDKSLPIYAIENDTLISKEKGVLSFGFYINYPSIYTLDSKDVDTYRSIMKKVFSVLEKNYIVHKQTYFISEETTPVIPKDETDLMRFNRIHFNGRIERKQYSFFYISKVPENYINFKSGSTNSFLSKEVKNPLNIIVDKSYISNKELNKYWDDISKIKDILKNDFFDSKFIEQDDYLDVKKSPLYLFNDFNKEGLSKDKTIVDNVKLYIGSDRLTYYTLNNVDDLPDLLDKSVLDDFGNGKNAMDKSMLSCIGLELDSDHVLNEYYYIPDQELFFDNLKKNEVRINNLKSWLSPAKKDLSDKKVESTQDDKNSINLKLISEFKEEVYTNNSKVIYTHINVGILNDTLKLKNAIDLDFKENTTNLKDLYMASCPGNSIGLPMEMYMPMTSDAALCLSYFENESKGNAAHGIRVVDVTTGNIKHLDVFETPKQTKIVDWVNAWCAGKTGSGKSFSMNTILMYEYTKGNHIFNIDGSSSFERSTRFLNGFFMKVSPSTKIGLNPFIISSNEEIKSKINFLSYFILLLLDDPKVGNKIARGLFRDVLTEYYNDAEIQIYSFNTFYEFFITKGKKIIIDNDLSDSISFAEIRFLLKSFYKGGIYDFLLNSFDPKLKTLHKNRYITFQLKEIKEDAQLFSIVTFLLINLYKRKLYDNSLLHAFKFIHFDESWQFMNNPVLQPFILDMIKTVRSQKGVTIFTSQEPEDIFDSEIGNAIINNSEIGIVADISSYADRKEKIQNLLSVTTKALNRLFSMHTRKFPNGIKAKEIGFMWGKKIFSTYGIEVSSEEAAVFESDPDKKVILNKIDEKYSKNMNLTIKDYAGN